MNQKPSFLCVTFISTTPEKLWEALTDPDFIARYWFGRRNVLNRFDQCSTEGSEENLNRRQQRKQRRIRGWVSVTVVPAGTSAPFQSSSSSSRSKWWSQMQRPMSVCRLIGDAQFMPWLAQHSPAAKRRDFQRRSHWTRKAL
jgi:hypothetical protein